MEPSENVRDLVDAGRSGTKPPDRLFGRDLLHLGMVATVETQVDANPQIPYQAAGLLLFRDSNNYIRLERGLGDFDAIAFEMFQNGSHVKFNGPFTGEPAPTRATTTSTGLWLVRDSDQVSAYWRDAAGNGPWQRLNTTTPFAGDSSAGLTVLNTGPSQQPFTAVYRSFTVSCGTTH